MSTLSTAMDTAKSSLIATQAQTAIVSRNIANLNTVGATRKYANVVTTAGGSVQVTSIAQSSNTVLFRNMLDANSAVGRGTVISNGLDRINDTIGDTTLGRSPAALVAKLGDALGTLAASPNNYELALGAATAAGNLVSALNEASFTVQTIRRDADNELVNAAADMTKILAKIQELNKLVVEGTRSGADITDLSDQRDREVVALSAYVGVTSQTRGDNDLVLYTDSGVTLFETTARSVEYSATPGLNESVASGNAFRIDGTPVTGSSAYMPLKSGSVAGFVTLRDDVLVTYQTQLDEIARGLVDAFKETAPNGTVSTGIFTASGLGGPATVSVGTFKAGAIALGDSLSFDFVQNDKTYRASIAFSVSNPPPTDAFAYRAQLQAAIDAATPIGGGAAFGAGKISVDVDKDAFTLSTPSSGVLGLSVSNLVVQVGAKDGGLAPAALASGTTTPPAAATIAIGTFDAGTIVKNDTLTFTFTYDGVAYSARQTFTQAPADAVALRALLQSAIDTAKPSAGGAALGTGKIVVDGTGTALGLSTVATGLSKSLSLSGIGTLPADPSAHTGGLAAGVSATTIVGLANGLRLAPAVLGDPTRIRDGVTNAYNTAKDGGFTTRLNQLSDALDASRSFASGSGADPSGSVADFAASSVSWLQANRQASISETDYKSTLLEQTQKALSNETGINENEQLVLMTELQRSFQASAKLLSTIDEMLQTLLNSI